MTGKNKIPQVFKISIKRCYAQFQKNRNNNDSLFDTNHFI